MEIGLISIGRVRGESQKEQDQDIEALLLSKNGNNIQEKNTPNIDDLPNIPAILDYALNLPSQGSIKHIDGNPTAQAFLTLFTVLSAASAAPDIFPNVTASSNKAISTDNPNSLLSGVTSAIGKMPILFDTTPATTSTSQNHAPSLIREKDGLVLHNADGNIIVSNNGRKLTLSHHLDIDKLEQQLTNSNITELCLWAVKIDPQKVQEIGNFLKGSNVKVLSILHGSIRNIGAIDFGTMLTGTKVTTLNLAYNGIGNKVAKGLVKSLKETNVEVLDLSDNRIGNTGKGAKDLIKLLGETNVKALDLSNNNMSDEKVNKIIPELEKNTRIIELGLKDKGIEDNTLKKVLKVLKQNRQVNKESTSTIKSSPTEGESSTTEEDHTSKKREKRDIHTTSSTEDTTVPTTEKSSTTTMKVTTSSPIEDSTTTKEETTVPTTKKSSTTTMKVTTSSPIEDSTTAKEETTVPTTKKSSTTTMKVTTSSTEGSATTEQETILPITEEFSTTTMKVTTSSPIEDSTTAKEETIASTTEESSTTTKRVTTSSTEGSATTEQETTVPTTLKSSTTTTKSTASSAGNPTTLKEELTTPKKNLTEKSEPIAADVVVDSITEKHTPKESNPNDPASSTMSTKEILALISFVLTAVSIGGGVAICVVKKFFDGVSRLSHGALALADLALVESDDRLDNNEETSSLTGVIVDDNADI